MKPKYRILSFDEELSRYVAWNEAITIAAAMKKVQSAITIAFASAYAKLPPSCKAVHQARILGLLLLLSKKINHERNR